MQRVGKNGKTHNVGSDHSWAEWQVPPVLCPGCGERVRLKDAFFGSASRGTFHAKPGCLPYEVRMVVTTKEAA